jgi:CBS domain-containing protein
MERKMEPKKVKNIAGLIIPHTVDLKTPLLELIEKFLKAPVIHQFYVVDEKKKLIGIINRDRLFRSLYHHYLQPSTRISELFQLATAENAEQILVAHVLSAKPDDDIYDVIKLMLEHDIYEIPVVDDKGRLCGKLDAIDFLKLWISEHAKG